MKPISHTLTGLIVIVWLLIPTWNRLPISTSDLLPLYTSRFVILLIMLLCIVIWMLLRFEGIENLTVTYWHLVWSVAALGFIVWSLASTQWALMSSFPTDSANYRPLVALSSAVQVTVVVVFAHVLVSRPSLMGIFRWVLTSGLVVVSVIAITQVQMQGATGSSLLSFLGEFDISPEKTGVSVLTAGEIRWLRPYGLLPHPNNLGAYLSVALLITASWLFVENSVLRWCGTIGLVVGFWALLLTFSRGAWLGFAVGALMALALLWHSVLRRNRDLIRQLVIAIALLLFTGAVFVIRYYPLVIARTAALQNVELTAEAVAGGIVENTESRSLVDRQVFNQLGWRIIREHPLFGVGMGNTPWQISVYLMETDMDLSANYVHNIYLASWADVGGIGLGLYLIASTSGLIAALHQPLTALRVSLIAGFVALAVTGFVDYHTWSLLPFQILWWGMLALAITPEPIQANDDVVLLEIRPPTSG